jgi:DNA end-binding protein Ku
MTPHALGSALISFGLVSIPIRLYTAASSAGVSFHLLHATCGHRIRQQLVCPVDHEVVERSGLVKGYEFAQDEYVHVTAEELKALEGEASKVIDITEFVPLARVDPLYFEKTYYLGPDKAGAKAYRLLAEAMATTDRVALATFVMRGKENLVLIRPAQHGLLLHTLYFADEVRDFGAIDRGETATIREGELELAVRLIEELSHAEVQPERYEDDYRRRVLDLVHSKVEGKEVIAVGPEVQRIQVIDLMDALRQSLAQRAAPATPPGAPPTPLPKKPSVKVGQRAPAATPGRRVKKVQASKTLTTSFTTHEGATIGELRSPSTGWPGRPHPYQARGMSR